MGIYVGDEREWGGVWVMKRDKRGKVSFFFLVLSYYKLFLMNFV